MGQILELDETVLLVHDEISQDVRLRINSKGGMGTRMGMTAFGPDSSTNSTLNSGWESPRNLVRAPADMAQSVADLLQRKSLSSTFGAQGEWEVRTTMVANPQTWRYHSSVYWRGKERKKGFPPIDVDRTREMRQIGAVTDEMLEAFANEAAEVHRARCDSLREYLTLAPFFTQSEPGYPWTKTVLLVLLSIAALVTAYWWWKNFNDTEPLPTNRQLSSSRLQWQPLQVAHQYRAGESFELALPRLEGLPEDVPVEVTLESSGDQPEWLQFDRDRLRIHGIAPLAAANHTYQLSVRAYTAQGSVSRLAIVLSIADPADRSPPVRHLPGHWAW